MVAGDGFDGFARAGGVLLDLGDDLADFTSGFGGPRASSFTSLATTAKPGPDSPALAASIVALSASRLVWSAI